MIICPSCGSSVKGDLCVGCPSCGARAIGPPLAKAEHQLISYGFAVIALVSGAMMLGTFLSAVIAVLFKNGSFPRHFSTIVAAGEVASWRLKWIAPPFAIGVLWGGARLIRTIKLTPARFAGIGIARAGFGAAILTTAMLAGLIGITIPERLRQHQDSIDADNNALAYTIQRAMLEYRERRGTFPSELKDLLKEVPDPDGSIATALSRIDANGYQPSTVLAAASTKTKSLVSRGGALRNAPTNTNADPPGVSFTKYDLRLPGPDKILNTDDDFIMRDGVLGKVSDPAFNPPSATTRSSAP